MIVDSKLLEILVCPRCKGELQVREDPPALICPRDELAFRVQEGIPIMLLDEAVPL